MRDQNTLGHGAPVWYGYTFSSQVAKTPALKTMWKPQRRKEVEACQICTQVASCRSRLFREFRARLFLFV
jgi:hypothetical protein